MEVRGARVLGVAATLALAALLLPVLPTRGSGPYSFPHRPHLTAETVEAALASAAGAARGGARPGGTVDRDCRVCHDWSRGPAAHLEGCAVCHQGSGNLEVARREGPAAGGRRPFPHAEHLEDRTLTCFSCHRPLMENDWMEFTVPAPGLGPAGVGGRPGGPAGSPTCADCHAAHEPAGETVPQFARTGDGRTCAECHRGQTSILPLALRPGGPPAGSGAPRPFRHADHGGAGTRCEDCHAAVKESRSVAGADEAMASTKACAACHMADASGTPLAGVASPPRATPLSFHAFGNFSHAAHLAPADRYPVNAKADDGCRTCHFPSGTLSAPAPLRRLGGEGTEPVGREALVDYDACLSCHEPWKVESHGVGAWSCFKCHAPEEDRPGHLPLGVARVERARVTSIARTVHPHPGITSKGPPLASPREKDGKDCRECHLAEVPAVPSRLAGKGFLHAPHLPAAPADGDCLACHPSATTASWSEDLAVFDPAACGKCHLGAGPADLGIVTDRREVRQFDHAAHAATGRRPSGFEGHACVECHETGGDAGYRVKEEAADCSRCHSHDGVKFPEKARRTGPKTSGEADAKRCLPCHLRETPGGTGEALWGARGPERREVARIHLDLLPGKQWHSLAAAPGDASGGCAACHERDPLVGKPPDYRERIESARVPVSIHEDPAHRGAWFNDPGLQKKDGSGDPEGKGRTCLTCHRQEPRNYLRALEAR